MLQRPVPVSWPVGALLVAAALACGGSQTEAPARTRSVGEAREAGAVAAGEARLAVADLWMPRSDGDDAVGLDPYLAPLIYVEVEPGAAVAEGAPLAAAVVAADGVLELDPGSPCVYFDDGTVRWRGREHRQTTFVWFRAFDDPTVPARAALRTTYGSDGFPAVIEVLEDEGGPERAYVTASVERAAASEHGPHADGRAAVAPVEAGELTVAGVLDEGAAPMGPYAYQAAASARVAGLHCRCVATRADELRERREYALVPLADLADAASLPRPTRPFEALRLPTEL